MNRGPRPARSALRSTSVLRSTSCLGGEWDVHVLSIRATPESYRQNLINACSLYNDDKKYAFMSRNGGPGARIFIPYIFSHMPVQKQILLTLESSDIQLYPKHLNKEPRWRRKVVKTGRPVNPFAMAAFLPSANWHNRGATPVRLQLMHGSESTPYGVATDLESAFGTAQSLLVRTSLLYILPTGLQYCEPSLKARCIACSLVLVNKGPVASELQWGAQARLARDLVHSKSETYYGARC